MSQDLNHDPWVRDLARLQPNSACVDRDAMLFACGRASAPRTRGWKIVVAVLAALQLVTLAPWLVRSMPHQPPVVESAMPGQQNDGRLPVAPSVPTGSYGEMVRNWERNGLPPAPVVTDPLPRPPTLSIATSHRVLEID